jgi:hypothetical protein
MPKLRVLGFGGENRALHPKALPDNVGTLSRNQKPGRGDLRPWRIALAVASVPAGRKSIYRMGRDVASDASYWLSWPTRVHAVRGFDAEDTTERTYFTGDGAPKVTDNILALAGAPYPTATRPLGLPAPASALSVSVNSGAWTGADNSYYYVYTHVNDWGWESAPSPVSAEVVRKTDATVTLSGFAAVPAGNYQINRLRLYRTQTGASGSTEFFFLREIAVGTASTTDDNRDLGEVLPTGTWLAPPADLTRLTALWNGMLAGISGNAVRLCEPYTPYAWPPAYDLVPPDAKPVAIGYFGQSLLVLTTGRPLLASGSSPEAMDQAPLELPQGCVSADSVVSMGAGVAWASEDGLCWYGSNGPRILTAGVMTREDWQALRPSSIVGQMYEGLYFGSYDDGSGRKGFMIDPMNPTGIFFLDTGYEAMHFDELQDQLYVLDGTQIKRWDAGSTFMTAKFRTKVHQAPSALSFSCAEVVADAYPLTLRVEALGLQASEVSAVLAAVQSGLVSAPTPTSLRYTATVMGRDGFRLPGGFTAPDWQIEIESATPVQEVSVATSMAELKS